MPAFIVKPNRDEDFYVRWSTVVDCPTGWGPRDYSEPGERYERADRNGTSAKWDGFADEDQPFGWGDETFILTNQQDLYHLEDEDHYLLLPRANLREFCRRRDAGESVEDLVLQRRVED